MASLERTLQSIIALSLFFDGRNFSTPFQKCHHRKEHPKIANVEIRSAAPAAVDSQGTHWPWPFRKRIPLRDNLHHTNRVPTLLLGDDLQSSAPSNQVVNCKNPQSRKQANGIYELSSNQSNILIFPRCNPSATGTVLGIRGLWKQSFTYRFLFGLTMVSLGCVWWLRRRRNGTVLRCWGDWEDDR